MLINNFNYQKNHWTFLTKQILQMLQIFAGSSLLDM